MRTATNTQAEGALPVLPCACANLRRAARAVTRMYNQELRASGLELTQFTLTLVDGGGRRPRSSFGKLPSLCIPGGSPTRGNGARDDPGRAASSRGPTSAEARAGDRRQSL